MAEASVTVNPLTPTRSPEAGEREHGGYGAITGRSVFVSLTLLFLSLLWLQQAGLITLTVQIDESVPPIPSVAAMMVMMLLAPLARRMQGAGFRVQGSDAVTSLLAQSLIAGGLVVTLLILNKIVAVSPFTLASAAVCIGLGVFLLSGVMTHAEFIVVYTMLAIGVSMSSVGAIRLFLPSITAPFYFATPENHYNEYNHHLPKWFAPQDHEVLRGLYEGAPNETAPWLVWLPYLAGWTLFFMVFFGTLLCLCSIVRRHWTDTERLSFPLVRMVLEISDPHAAQADARGEDAAPAFFRNPIMWIGFGLAFMYNAANMINAYNPSFLAPGKNFDIGVLFTEKPLSAMKPFTIEFRPEIFGIGYLMSMEVLFTAWFFFLVFKAQQMFASAAGYEIAGLPFPQEQATGAYVALGLSLLYFARKPLTDVARSILNPQSSILNDVDEPLPYRLAVFGALGGFAFLVAWCACAGMAVTTAALYLGMIIGFALIYSRVRAETGAPYIWLFPYYQARKTPVYWFGSGAFGERDMTVWSSMMFLSRGFFPQFASYQLEGFKMADEVGMSRRDMAKLLMFACFVGVVGALWIHLSTYYHYGANVLEGGTTSGGWRTQLVNAEWTDLVTKLKTPVNRDLLRMGANTLGFLISGGLVLLRMVFLRFPLHPLGFAMVSSYAQVLFGPFLFVWLIKLMILKFGGMRLYKQLVPMFLGIVMGHYMTAGLMWGLLSMSGNEVFRRYGVWFG